MKGTVFPRPSVKDPETGRRRPVKKHSRRTSAHPGCEGCGGSTWTYQFAVLHNGTRRHVSKGGFPTKQEAQDALTAALAEHAEGGVIQTTRMTVRKYFLDEWLPSRRGSLKASTYSGYRTQIESHIVPHLGEEPLTALTPKRLADHYAWLREQGGRRSEGSPLSPSSVRQVGVIIRRALDDAVRRQLLRRNPAQVVELDKLKRPEMACWTAEEARRFLEHVQSDRLSALWLLALARGPRRGELLGLRWSHVDLAAGQLSVVRNHLLVDGEIVEDDPKRRKSVRTVALDDELVAAFRRHWKLQLEERLAWGEGYVESDLVFTREDGSRLAPDSLSRHIFPRLAKGADVPLIRFHDLRHTMATLALKAGIPAEIVSKWLGHASVAITVDTYQHAVPQLMAEYGSRVTGLLIQRPNSEDVSGAEAEPR